MQFPRYTVDLLWAEATNRLVLVLYAETTNSVHGGLFFLFITQSIVFVSKTKNEFRGYFVSWTFRRVFRYFHTIPISNPRKFNRWSVNSRGDDKGKFN
jgi:hypothetical protein